MNFYDLFTTMGINVGVEEYRSDAKAVLLDVRSKQDYDSGHIPGSVNIPWREMGRVLREYPDVSTPFYIYCKNGSRSRQAVTLMKRLGYKNLTNIGGIQRYRGELES